MTIVDAVEVLVGRQDPVETPALPAATEFGLSATLANALRSVAARHATTPCAVALAGYLAVLYRYSGQDELVLAGADGAALRVRLAEDPAFGMLLDQVSPGLLAGADPARLAAHDLALSVRDSGDTLRARIEYDPGAFAPAAVARLRGHLVQLLDGAAANPGLRLSRLPLLTPAEEAEFERWNATHADYSADQLVPELIAAQAAATPDATALEFAGATLTYRELEERSSRLAHHLRALGVGPDIRVAVYLERSFDLVVTLVAVLKAGGAYVPLDPSYPPARLAFIVSDAQAPVLVTHGELADRLATPGATVVRIDTADLA
ncbi:MAG TPA: AMP-binding protein, partial [Trebonia sp.]